MVTRSLRLALPVCAVPAVVLSLGLLSGCDEQSVATKQAALKLDTALQAYAKADIVAPGTQGAGYAAQRLEALEQAVAPLKDVATTGSDAQKVVARKLLANIESAAADAYSKDAASAFANLRARAANLAGLLDTVDAISARMAFADRDPATAIADLDDAIAEYTDRRDSVATQAQGRQAAVAGLQAKIAEKQDEARARFAEKIKLESDAFVQTGDAKYDLLDQAAKLQHAADTAEVQALEFGIELETVQAELDLLQRELELVTRGIDRFEQARAGFAESGKVSKQAVASAQQDRQAELDKASSELEALVQAYETGVAGPMQQAIERARGAVSQLESAPRVAGNDVSLERLDKQLGLTQTLARAAVYADAIQQTVAGFTRRPALAGNVATTDAADRLAASVAQRKEQATEALNTALDTAQNAPEDDALVAAIKQSLQRIQSDLAKSAG